jgi:uncharacterized membrane protein
MSENTIAAIGFSLIGLLYIGLGLPLLRGWIQPNGWYRYRTKKTLSSERIWFAVNRVTGRDLIICGAALIITAASIHFVGQDLKSSHAASILLAVLVLSVLVML